MALGCKHPGFIHNACMQCGASETECSKHGRAITTIPVGYMNIDPTLTLNVQEMDRLRDDNLRHLLCQKKLHLILDLDNTLVHSTNVNNVNLGAVEFDLDEDMHLILNNTMVLKLRPGACAFLEQARKMFELSIYTMGTRAYAKSVARLLDPKGLSLFGEQDWRVISREHCTTKMQKGLDVVLSHPRVVLIVDDKEEVWAKSDKANVVSIAPYSFFGKSSSSRVQVQQDVELDRVLRLLTEIHSMFFEDGSNNEEDYMVKDVRPLILIQGVRSLMGTEEKSPSSKIITRRTRSSSTGRGRWI